MRTDGLPLVDRLWKVQVEATGKDFGRDFQYPSREDLSWHRKGLEILQKIDPDLKWYLEPEA